MLLIRTSIIKAFCCTLVFGALAFSAVCEAAPTDAPASADMPSAPSVLIGSSGSGLGVRGLFDPAHGWIIDGSLDARYRTATTGRSNETYLNQGELDIGRQLYVHNTHRGNLYLQIIGENVPDAFGGKGEDSDIEIGEAYVSYRLPIQTDTGSTAYLRLGQFILPVGLLPVYDSHLHILQTLAPQGIGERIDYGAMLEGQFNGIYNYQIAITSGTGADRLNANPTHVLAGRLGRLFSTPYGIFNIGGSLLSGRLPVTEVDPTTGFPPLLPPSGHLRNIYGFVNKTRIVGDGQWIYRAATVRGEVMTGADDSNAVDGYFLMGEYRFAPGLDAVLARTYWDYGKQNSTSSDDAVGMDITYGSNLVVRALYEEQRDVPYSTGVDTPAAPSHLRHIFTVQTVVRF